MRKQLSLLCLPSWRKNAGSWVPKHPPPKKMIEKSNKLTIKIFLLLAGGAKDAIGQKVWISSRRDQWFVANLVPSETRRLNVGERWGGRPKL